MKNGWLNLDLLEFLTGLSFLVFLFIKCEEFLQLKKKIGLELFVGEIFT